LRTLIIRLGRWSVRITIAILLLAFVALSFFTVQASRRERRSASEVAPAEGRFVGPEGSRIFIQTRGPEHGLPVVFTHGMGAWSELWRATLDAVGNAGFRAIAMDLPPFGFSDRSRDTKYTCAEQAARIVGVLDALRIRRAVFVGHSFGGGPTLEAALRRPDRVHALVLADPAVAFDAPAEPSPVVTTLISVRPLRNAILSGTVTNPMFTRYLMSRFVAKPEAVSPERVAILQRPLEVRGTTDALGDWLVAFSSPERGLRTQAPTAYASFDRPTLIIWGALDSTTPLDQGQRLNRLIPKSQLAVMDGIGHMPQIEDPEQFNRLLLQFLQRNATSASTRPVK
jgi:pimeloyl-ACP methyl ester carboxylesterase